MPWKITIVGENSRGWTIRVLGAWSFSTAWMALVNGTSNCSIHATYGLRIVILHTPGDSKWPLFPYLEVTQPWKGSLDHPKKGHKELPGIYVLFLKYVFIQLYINIHLFFCKSIEQKTSAFFNQGARGNNQPGSLFPGAWCEKTPKNTYSTPCGCFLKWWYPHFTPQVLIIFSLENPIVVGETHHFRKPPCTVPVALFRDTLEELHTLPRYKNGTLLDRSDQPKSISQRLMIGNNHPRGSMYGIFTYIWVIFMVNIPYMDPMGTKLPRESESNPPIPTRNSWPPGMVFTTNPIL